MIPSNFELVWNSTELSIVWVGFEPVQKGKNPGVSPGDAVMTFSVEAGVAGDELVLDVKEIDGWPLLDVEVHGSADRTNADGGNPPMVSASAAFKA